ncbi:tetratricopeptide repeat protein [Sphingomonas sp. PP-CE-3G-477]|nr:tetratricopeptide repeat protein [Sphingomonas sp. PP-CE-3G-477]
MATAADFIAALNRRDRPAAVDAANRLVASNAMLGDQWQAIARFAVRVAEWPLAIDAMRRFVARKPGDLDRTLQLADIFASAGRLDDAIALIAPLAQRAPGDARLHHLLGTAYIQVGNVASGLDHLNAAARIWPASGMTWLAIASAQRYASGSTAFAALLTADRDTARAAPTARAAYLYAMGKAWEDLGEYDRAFDAFDMGATLIRGERPWDADGDEAAALALVKELDRSWLDEAALPDLGPTGPIFVTGLPRSGTTLLDQILASHSVVSSGGELNLLEVATGDAGGSVASMVRRHFETTLDAETAWGPIGLLYRHLVEQRGAPSARFVDKSLDTSRYAGLIRLAMPDARLIWIRRDPLDAAWSCFRTYFSQGLGWTFGLDTIARHFAAEDVLFEHWSGALGSRLLVVPYEELVQDIGEWVPRIARHAGLAFEPAMLDFHRLKRSVTTASVAQVRQPLYQRAVGGSAPYAARLAPFVADYAQAKAALASKVPVGDRA